MVVVVLVVVLPGSSSPHTPQAVKEMVELSAAYEKAVKQETELTAEQLVVATVGKMVSHGG